MAKRANGEGTIYQRRDGRWVGKLSLGHDPTGKRIRKTVYGKSQGEVREKLEGLKLAAKRGTKAIVGRDTVTSYLDRWLADDVRINRASRTVQEYELAVRSYIKPKLGRLQLNKLNGEHLQSWQSWMVRQHFTPNMRLRGVRVLRNALNKAIRLGLITHNPCQAIDKPKVSRKAVTVLEPSECFALFHEAEQHRIGDIITVATMTGLRKGELFALEWSAINLAEGVLVVRQTLENINGHLSLKEPKTRAGRRVVVLSQTVIEALKRRRVKASYEGLDYCKTVFPDTRGGCLRSSNFDRNVWYPIRNRAGVSDQFTFHDLRHTAASLMIGAGTPMKVIQERLGHVDFATTANIYSHLLKDAQADAVARTEEFLRSERSRETLVGTLSGDTAAEE